MKIKLTWVSCLAFCISMKDDGSGKILLFILTIMGTGLLRPVCIFHFPHCYSLHSGTLEVGVVRRVENIWGLLTVGLGLMFNRQYGVPNISRVLQLVVDIV